MLLHSALLKCFIYSRVKTSWILHGATIPVAPTKNKVKALSIHLIRKKVSFLSNYILPTHKKNQSNHEKIHAYLTDSSQYSSWLLKKYSSLQHLTTPGWTSIGLWKVWLLHLIKFSKKLSAINDCLKISTFFMNEHYS